MKHFFFDFDGVIIDSFEVCYDRFYSEYGGTRDQYRELFMGNFFECLQKLPLERREDTLHLDHKALTLENKLKLPLYPGMDQVLQQYHEHSNGSMYIISSSQSDSISTRLEENGVLQYFQQVLGADVEKSKTKKFEYIFANYDISPTESYFVTDTVGDVLEGKKADIPSIAVTRGFHSAQQLEQATPAYIVHTPQELLSIDL